MSRYDYLCPVGVEGDPPGHHIWRNDYEGVKLLNTKTCVWCGEKVQREY